MSEYKTVRGSSYYEFKEKKSKFISNCINVNSTEEALHNIDKIKSKYHDAKHNTYAYYICNPEIIKYSDDSEPQGTAGIQILTAIKHFELKDVLIVTTRYFGGTLLGVGNLSRAYRKSAEECIKQNQIIIKKLCLVVNITVPYSFISQIYSILDSSVSSIQKIDYYESVEITAFLQKESLKTIEKQLSKCFGGKINFNILGEKYFCFN